MDPGLATFLAASVAALVGGASGYIIKRLDLTSKRRMQAAAQEEAQKKSNEDAAARQMAAWQTRLEGMDQRVYERMQASIENLEHRMDEMQQEMDTDRRAWEIERAALSNRVRTLSELVYRLRTMLINRGIPESDIPTEET